MVVLTLVAAAVLAGLAPAAETPVEAPGPAGPLRGTLRTPPRDGAPVVLIVPGSGPTDRNGDNPQGVRAATYRLLAEGLAEKGIASARIDKRGMFGSASAIADANAVTIDDYVADVLAWAKVLRATTGQPCVWVLGHSEGGLVALALDRQASGICGLILVATPGQPMGEVMRRQLRANPANAPILDQALAAIDALEAGRRVDTAAMHPAIGALFHPAVQGYLINAFALDPAKRIAAATKPILILQGARDIQVDVADAERLHRAAPAARLVVLPGVNHVLKSVNSDDRAANVATYADPALPLAPGVIDAIAAFIDAPAKAR